MVRGKYHLPGGFDAMHAMEADVWVDSVGGGWGWGWGWGNGFKFNLILLLEHSLVP